VTALRYVRLTKSSLSQNNHTCGVSGNVERGGKKIIQVSDRSMNSSRQMYCVGEMLGGDDSRGFKIKRENIPMHARTHSGRDQ